MHLEMSEVEVIVMFFDMLQSSFYTNKEKIIRNFFWLVTVQYSFFIYLFLCLFKLVFFLKHFFCLGYFSFYLSKVVKLFYRIMNKKEKPEIRGPSLLHSHL